MSRPKVYWFDDEIACIDCICGEAKEMIIHGEFDRCSRCGRGYRVVQYVEVAESDASPPAEQEQR